MAELKKGDKTITYSGNLSKALASHPNHNATPSNRQKPRRLRLS